MIPEKFRSESEAAGTNPLDAWSALQDQALNRLEEEARSGPGWVTLSSALVVAKDIFGEYGEDVVKKEALTTLTYGSGKRLWDIRFFNEDGTEIPPEIAFSEMRAHLGSLADESWEFGKTIIRWVLEDTA